jgi:glycogen debranching enzyme
MPWSEWEYFLNFGDIERLRSVFPPLLAFTQWMHKHRRWPDGGYWLSGWGCGMDNIPRLQPGYHVNFDHGQMVWIDATLQQILANRHLIAMAEVLGRESDIVALKTESDFLARYVNEKLWDETNYIYADLWEGGQLNGVKSIAAFWALLADVAPADRVQHLVAHLRNPAEFNRPHRVPSLSADHPEYHPGGDYWRGSIWPPTNYMVLRGLTNVHEDALAHEIALNHVDNVTNVFQDTGTLWENYAPESPARGSLSGRDFVGWAGVPPIAVLLEYVFGLRPDASEKRLLWDVRLLDSHGVKHYPFGADGSLDLFCAGRKSEDEEPRIEATSTLPVKLVVRWKAGEKELALEPRH